MKGIFEILVNGELLKFTDYNDIPESFDNLIKFMPEYPEGPHTQEQHDEIHHLNDYLIELMKREK